MEKIAILTCLKSNMTCSRAGCLKAFNERTAFFADYPSDTQLCAMMTCNGCSSEQPVSPGDDEGMIKKIERLKSEGVSTVHVGVCRMKKDGTECGRITEICEMLEKSGLKVVRGTHKEHSPAAQKTESK